MVKNNSENNSNRHNILIIFQIDRFVLVMVLVWNNITKFAKLELQPIEHSENKIITQPGSFENEVGPGVL